MRHLGRRRRLRLRRRRLQGRDQHFDAAAPFDLLGERAGVVEQDDAGHGLQQHAILFRHLLAAADEDAAGLVDERRFRAGGDEVHDRVLQRLAINRVVFVPDHQVDASPFMRQ